MRTIACMIGAIALPVALAVCLGGCESSSPPESDGFRPWGDGHDNFEHVVWRLKNIESKLDQVIAAQKAAMPAEKPR